MRFVELYAGLASVSLYIAGGYRPPVSRIGAKSGYAKAIVEALGAAECDSFLLVDADPSIARVLASLVSPIGRAVIADRLRSWPQSRQKWEELRAADDFRGHDEAARWLYVTAARRGGVGGFKGKHKLRPSVDGFIPTITSLVTRVLALNLDPTQWEVRCEKAGNIAAIPGCVVYLDPPYHDRQGYPDAGDDTSPEVLFGRWAAAGSRVGLSEGRRLDVEGYCVDLTEQRHAQSRRSLTRSNKEYLFVGGPSAAT